MSIFPIPYRIQSVDTKAFVISTQNDKPGQEVETKPGKDSIPEESVRAQLSLQHLLCSSNVTLIHFWSGFVHQHSDWAWAHCCRDHWGRSETLIYLDQGQSRSYFPSQQLLNTYQCRA